MGILLLLLLSFVIQNLLVLQLNSATEEGFRHLDDDTKSENGDCSGFLQIGSQIILVIMSNVTWT